MSTTTLGALLYAFFEHFLKAQKGVSTATIKSYRDAVRMFLLFVAEERQVKFSTLCLHRQHRRRINAVQVVMRHQCLQSIHLHGTTIRIHAGQSRLTADQFLPLVVIGRRNPNRVIHRRGMRRTQIVHRKTGSYKCRFTSRPLCNTRMMMIPSAWRL